MAKKNKSPSSNTIILQPGANIGNISAEADDEFLFSCFYDHPSLNELSNLENSKIFASGRTGAGKTAILKMIEKNQKDSSEIDLIELSLSYVANSDILQFLLAIEIDLDLFFQTLWKHVLAIEFIRLRFKGQNKQNTGAVLDFIKQAFFRDERKEKAIDYLKTWGNTFWVTMDENIREITQKLETEISAELSGEVEKFKARAGYARTLSNERKTHVSQRAKKIVNSDMLADLSKVIELLSELDKNEKYPRKFYILIDKLDEKWVDESIRFQLIRALIECLKSFRKIRNLKVIVALRSDVIERVLLESSHTGFQREKYDDYFLRIRWTKSQLRELVDKRINYLYRKKYSSENVFFTDIFEHKVGSANAFEYMIERTLLRPRDIISFVNICLDQSEGTAKVSQSTLKKAEGIYSQIRLQALISEWESSYPSIRIAFDMISGGKPTIKLGEICAGEFIELFILRVDELQPPSYDPLQALVKQYMDSSSISQTLRIAKSVFSILYRIGAGSLKINSHEPYLHVTTGTSTVNPDLINEESKLYIHPMLHRALNINTNLRT